MAHPETDNTRRVPTALIIVVLVTILGVAIVLFVASAGNETSDVREQDPVTDTDIEVPVERGVPGEGEDEDEPGAGAESGG